jgi:Binding-prot-dependent transport system membrane comp, N-term
VVTFIIRRLIATVFLLIVVSMITYAIFFLIPRLAGQNSYQLATEYVGRNPTRAAVLQIEQKLGAQKAVCVDQDRRPDPGNPRRAAAATPTMTPAIVHLLIRSAAVRILGLGTRSAEPGPSQPGCPLTEPGIGPLVQSSGNRFGPWRQ